MARRAKINQGTPAAAYSCLHLVRKNGVHPYLKRVRPDAARPSTPRTFAKLCAAYEWPTSAPGGGGVIAIIELGGGWTQSDVTQFFTNANLPAPNITDLSVDCAPNRLRS